MNPEANVMDSIKIEIIISPPLIRIKEENSAQKTSMLSERAQLVYYPHQLFSQPMWEWSP